MHILHYKFHASSNSKGAGIMNLRIENLTKSYGGRRVLDVETLEFETGKVYAILGLNGSGKSTLLECISGLTEFDCGKILYDGETSLSTVKNKISIMTQKHYLFNKSVLDNIRTGLVFRKFNEEQIKERVYSYLGHFSLEPLLDKNAKKLSGGEGAKTALLRTAVLETDLTLLDEPTASMDLESTLQAEELIKSMVSNKRTVIIVTHDLFQAQRIADFIIFMDKGKIIEMGSREDVFKNPKNKLVKMILNKG
jgi:tungstate transport system ATP-binding protein